MLRETMPRLTKKRYLVIFERKKEGRTTVKRRGLFTDIASSRDTRWCSVETLLKLTDDSTTLANSTCRWRSIVNCPLRLLLLLLLRFFSLSFFKRNREADARRALGLEDNLIYLLWQGSCWCSGGGDGGCRKVLTLLAEGGIQRYYRQRNGSSVRIEWAMGKMTGRGKRGSQFTIYIYIYILVNWRNTNAKNGGRF